ncbi:hypothetical protein V6N13_110225 [Hibiscus sabdariffa]
MLASAMASANPKKFYKLSLQWGRSMCNNEHMRCPTLLPPSVDQKLTIHGLWPHDTMDDPVDLYMHTHPCIPKPPTGSSQLPESEWMKHVTCSDFAHEPFKYFKSALQIRASLPAFRINPGDKYKVKEVIALVK